MLDLFAGSGGISLTSISFNSPVNLDRLSTLFCLLTAVIRLAGPNLPDVLGPAVYAVQAGAFLMLAVFLAPRWPQPAGRALYRLDGRFSSLWPHWPYWPHEITHSREFQGVLKKSFFAKCWPGEEEVPAGGGLRVLWLTLAHFGSPWKSAGLYGTVRDCTGQYGTHEQTYKDTEDTFIHRYGHLSTGYKS